MDEDHRGDKIRRLGQFQLLTLASLLLLAGISPVPSQSSYSAVYNKQNSQQCNRLSFIYLVATCAYGKMEYVRSLHVAIKRTKDSLPKMLDIATFYNRSEVAQYCSGAAAPSNFPKSL